MTHIPMRYIPTDNTPGTARYVVLHAFPYTLNDEYPDIPSGIQLRTAWCLLRSLMFVMTDGSLYKMVDTRSRARATHRSTHLATVIPTLRTKRRLTPCLICLIESIGRIARLPAWHAATLPRVRRKHPCQRRPREGAKEKARLKLAPDGGK